MTNAIVDKLLDLQHALATTGNSQKPHTGIRFVGELISHVQAGKPGTVTVGDETYPFTCDQVDVDIDNMVLKAGDLELPMLSLKAGENGEYETVVLVDEVNLLGETVTVSINQA